MIRLNTFGKIQVVDRVRSTAGTKARRLTVDVAGENEFPTPLTFELRGDDMTQADGLERGQAVAIAAYIAVEPSISAKGTSLQPHFVATSIKPAEALG